MAIYDLDGVRPEAEGDHWIAETNLQSALTSGSPGGVPAMNAGRTATASTAAH